MKLILFCAISIFILNTFAPAQNTFDYPQASDRRLSTLFQAAFEVGLLEGGIFDRSSKNPLQFGFRAGYYGFVSNLAAVGAGARISLLPLVDFEQGSWNGGLGPELILAPKALPNHYGFFARFHVHYIRQKSTRSSSNSGYNFPFLDGTGTSDAGFEIGALIGGMRFYRGAVFGGGLAYAVMPDANDGVRIYITLGIAGARAKL